MLCVWKDEDTEAWLTHLARVTDELEGLSAVPAEPPVPGPRPVHRRRGLAVLAGVVGLAVVAGVLVLYGGSAEQTAGATEAPDTMASQPGQCPQGRCRGKDPAEQGCRTGAVVLADRTIGETHLEVRYSPSCAAVWASAVYGPRGATLSVTDPATGDRMARVLGTARYARSAMLDAAGRQPVRGCLQTPTNEICVDAVTPVR
jgi:hypothetical protein